MGNKQSNSDSKSNNKHKDATLKEKESRGSILGYKTEKITSVYTMGDKLGEPGQFGYAQMVTHKATGKKYAVKIISKARFRCNQFEPFRRELQIMKDMDHENIIKGYEAFEDKKNIYFVMDLCLGGELFDRIKAKPERYSENDAAVVLKQILSGIEYLHNRKIAHCDLKPDNFLFLTKEEDSIVKIIDFGMSKFTQSQEYLENMAGTSFYMAPEVLQGHYTYHCDMWSFGVVMFITLFGFPPFHGTSDKNIHEKIAKGFTPETLPGYGAHFPEKIKISEAAKDLIAKCLHFDPAIRLTATEAREHPWFNDADSTPLGTAVLNNLTSFTANCQFKAAVLGALSSSLSVTELEDLKTSFKAMDLNGDGVVTVDELKQSMKNGESKSTQAIAALLQMADVDGDGALSYEELVVASVQKKLLAKEERLYNTFCQLDRDGNGTVTAQEIEEVLGMQEDVKAMIAEVDTDKDGTISWEEFRNMMVKADQDPVVKQSQYPE